MLAGKSWMWLAALAAVPAQAQTSVPVPVPAPAAAPLPPLAIAQPEYVTLVLGAEINRPAAEAWQRIGKYCAIGEWMQMACRLTAGDEWSVGSVRLLRESIVEVLVAKTPLSYTYAQPPRAGVPYNLYHGTLALEPVSARRSRLVYTFLYDVSMLPAAERPKEMAARKARFAVAIANMKALAEGGTIPAP